MVLEGEIPCDQILTAPSTFVFAKRKSIALIEDGYGLPNKFKLSSKFVITTPFVPA